MASGVSIGEIYGRLFLVDDLSPSLAQAQQNLSQFSAAATQFASAINNVGRQMGTVTAASTQVNTAAQNTTRSLTALGNAFAAAGGAGGAAGGGIGGAGAAARTAGGHAQNAGGFFDQLGVRLFGVVTVSHLAADAITGLSSALVEAITNSAKLAARVEMLQGVSKFLARQQGYSADQTEELAQQMKAQGITSQQAYNGIAQLVRANVDLSYASKLAAIAQNTARLSGLNSSETFEKLTHAIVTQNSRILHTIGLNLTLASAVKSSANETGKSIQQMTQAEKQQTLLNAIMQAGTRIAGVYGETNEFVGGRLMTLQRLQEEANLSIGKHFLDAMKVAVDGLSKFYVWVQKNSDTVVLLTGSVVVLAATMGGLAFSQWIAGFGGLAAGMNLATAAATRLIGVIAAGFAGGGVAAVLTVVGLGAALGLLTAGFARLTQAIDGSVSSSLDGFDAKLVETITMSSNMAKVYVFLRDAILGVTDALLQMNGIDIPSWWDFLFGKQEEGFIGGTASLPGVKMPEFKFSDLFPEGPKFGVVQWLADVGNEIGLGFVDIGSKAAESLSTGFQNALKGASGVFDSVMQWMESVDELITGQFDKFKENFALLRDALPTGAIGDLIRDVGDSINSLGEMWHSYLDSLDEAESFVGRWVGAIAKFFTDLATSEVDDIQKMIDKIREFLGYLPRLDDPGHDMLGGAAKKDERSPWFKGFENFIHDKLDDTSAGKVANWFALVTEASAKTGRFIVQTDVALQALDRTGKNLSFPQKLNAQMSQTDLNKFSFFGGPGLGLGSIDRHVGFDVAGQIEQTISAGAKRILDEEQNFNATYDRVMRLMGEKIRASVAVMGTGGKEAKRTAADLFGGELDQKGNLVGGLFDEETSVRILNKVKDELKETGKSGTKAADELKKAWADIHAAMKGPETLKESTTDMIMNFAQAGMPVKELAKSIAIVQKESKDAVDSFTTFAIGIAAADFKPTESQLTEINERLNLLHQTPAQIEKEMRLPTDSVKRMVEEWKDAAEIEVGTRARALAAWRLWSDGVQDAALAAMKAAEEMSKVADQQSKELIEIQNEDTDARMRLVMGAADFELMQLERVHEAKMKGLFDEKGRQLTPGLGQIEKDGIFVDGPNAEKLRAAAQKAHDFQVFLLTDIVERMHKAGVQSKGYLDRLALDAEKDFRQMAESGKFTAEAISEAFDKMYAAQKKASSSWLDVLTKSFRDLMSELAESAAQLGEILGPGAVGNFFKMVGAVANAATQAAKGADRMAAGLAKIKVAASLENPFAGLDGAVGVLAQVSDQAEKAGQGLGKIKFGMYAAGAIDLAGGLLQAATAFMQVTDSASKAQRAIGGALVGSEIGAAIGSLFGPIGEAIGKIAGTIIGAIAGLFRKPGFVDVMQRVGREWGVTISEELAKSIELDAKKLFHGDRQAAEIFHLKDIIEEAGGLNKVNFDEFIGHLRDVFSMLETGKLNFQQFTQVINDNWSDFVEAGTSNSGVFADSLREIIRLAQELGLITDEMRDTIQNEVSRAQEGWNAVIKAGTEGFEDFPKRIEDIKKRTKELTDDLAKVNTDWGGKKADSAFKIGDNLLDQLSKSGDKTDLALAGLKELNFDVAKFIGMKPEDAFNAVRLELMALGDPALSNRLGHMIFGDDYLQFLRDLDEYNSKVTNLNVDMTDRTRDLKSALTEQRKEAEKNRQVLEDMGIVAVGAFGAALASGKTFFEALRAAAPGLKDLADGFRKLGINPKDSGVLGLMIQGRVQEKTPNLTAGVEGFGNAVTGLANVNMLTPATLTSMENVLGGLFTRYQGEIHNAAVEFGDLTGDHTADALLPFQAALHAIVDESAKLNRPLSATTQNLVDMSKNAGLWEIDFRTGDQKIEDATKTVSATVAAMAKSLGEIMKQSGREVVDAIGTLGALISQRPTTDPTTTDPTTGRPITPPTTTVDPPTTAIEPLRTASEASRLAGADAYTASAFRGDPYTNFPMPVPYVGGSRDIVTGEPLLPVTGEKKIWDGGALPIRDGLDRNYPYVTNTPEVTPAEIQVVNEHHYHYMYVDRDISDEQVVEITTRTLPEEARTNAKNFFGTRMRAALEITE